ncbi:Gfo/Idh/MocA family protein [Klebsiella grimontii]|uniref:Gfo/Idh/MocA family protein n=1 Tax=Klebsiella grimontii TaxID=2058152 RepID=UPI0011749C97|nr:Gfo/Idh/MocA family oxidoreductase [Klebsiella grimontii]VUS41176.1 Inositol 2-dehydrogenase/D-chiro-inositol 3-dehydrogenase [Klebsiella grimontii]
MSYRAGIIGFGKSGERFLKSIECVHELDVVGVCDIFREKLEKLGSEKITTFTDFKEMLDVLEIDILFIATNDDEHFNIFKHINKSKLKNKKIVCEKPIVTKKHEIEFLENNFIGSDIAVHFVERYSPAVELLMEYIIKNNRKVTRIDFEWSKFRVLDKRKTIGVTSEISHPLDLSLFIAQKTYVENINVINCWIEKIDFQGRKKNQPGYISLSIEVNGDLIVCGTSSYIKSSRRRHMEFLLTDCSGAASDLAVIDFDNPEWDDDHLSIYDLNRMTRKKSFTWSNAKNKTERSHISKICRFIEHVISDINGEQKLNIANLEQSVLVQNIIISLEKNATISHHQLFDGFHEKNTNYKNAIKEEGVRDEDY